MDKVSVAFSIQREIEVEDAEAARFDDTTEVNKLRKELEEAGWHVTLSRVEVCDDELDMEMDDE